MKYIYIKKRCQGQNFLDPRLLSERERERGRESDGPRETFSHNFDLYVVQTAERVYINIL